MDSQAAKSDSNIRSFEHSFVIRHSNFVIKTFSRILSTMQT